MPTLRRPSPIALRQLVVHDLDDIDSTDFDRSSFRIPRPTLILPNVTRPIPTDESLWWTSDDRPSYVEEFSSISNPPVRTQFIERPSYQITPPPTPPPPPSPIQYQIVPISSLQRPSPIQILRRIRKTKYFKEKTPGLCTTLCSGGFGTITGLIYLVIILALPIAKLVLGILYINDCPINSNIPLYVLVSGACGLGIILFLLLASTCIFFRSSTIARKSTHRFIIGTIACARGMQGVIALFLFIWFFLGNFWVFGARYRVRTDKPNDINNYCQPALYWFAFYVLIFTYVFAIFMCFMKFCGNFFCCGACDMWKRAFS